MLFVGGALAAVAGILSSMNYRSVDISVGTSMGVKAFAATVLGGIGSVGGAALGGLIIGVSEVLVAGYVGASLRDMAAYLILIAILIIRPSGLMGIARKEGVSMASQPGPPMALGALYRRHSLVRRWRCC